jgi:hypothetical protein
MRQTRLWTVPATSLGCCWPKQIAQEGHRSSSFAPKMTKADACSACPSGSILGRLLPPLVHFPRRSVVPALASALVVLLVCLASWNVRRVSNFT